MPADFQIWYILCLFINGATIAKHALAIVAVVVGQRSFVCVRAKELAVSQLVVFCGVFHRAFHPVVERAHLKGGGEGAGVSA